MAVSVSRMQFLRGDFNGSRPAALRPPWAIPEQLFIETCNGCGECVRICPENILKLGRGKLPEVDFSHGYCSFCGECAAVCREHVFDRDRESAWDLKADFSESCLPFQGVTCYTCEECCEEEAIRFRLGDSASPLPSLDAEACNGCGACFSPCPAGAIAIRHAETGTPCNAGGNDS